MYDYEILASIIWIKKRIDPSKNVRGNAEEN